MPRNPPIDHERENRAFAHGVVAPGAQYEASPSIGLDAEA